METGPVPPVIPVALRAPSITGGTGPKHHIYLNLLTTVQGGQNWVSTDGHFSVVISKLSL